MFTSAEVVPVVNFSRLDEVMVVLDPSLPLPSTSANASIGAPP